MEGIENISENENYTAIHIGPIDELKKYSVWHKLRKVEREGKVFVKEATKATGTQISFQVLDPKTDLPYFHRHIQNEETYIVLSGEGFFQVDNDCFPVSEGSVVRIAPNSVRGFCNTSDVPMNLICIQSKQHSLEQYDTDDAELVDVEPLWKNKQQNTI